MWAWTRGNLVGLVLVLDRGELFQFAHLPTDLSSWCVQMAQEFNKTLAINHELRDHIKPPCPRPWLTRSVWSRSLIENSSSGLPADLFVVCSDGAGVQQDSGDQP